jgi:HlyD family secretion protein
MDRMLDKKRKLPQKIGIGIIVSAALGFVIYNLFFVDHNKQMSIASEEITIVEVKNGAFREFIPVDGIVQPLKTIYLDVVQGGYVEKKFIDGGNEVKAGDMLLKLSNHNLMMEYVQRETMMYDLINNLQNSKLRLKQNRFDLRKRLSQLDYEIDAAKDLHERNHKLFKERVISEQEYQKSKREYDRLAKQYLIEIESQKFDSINAITLIQQQEDGLERTYKNLALFKQNMGNLYIKAPFDGQLASLNVEIGQYITTGQRIGQIDDLKGFKVKASIDEHYISRIFTGQVAEFETGGKLYELTVLRVYPEVTSHHFDVDLVFKNANYPSSIRRGQTLQLRLQLSDPVPSLLLARGGFFQTTGGNWIFVVDKGGEYAIRRDIELGRQNPQNYEVLKGLKEGEKAIVSNYERFERIDQLNIR